MCHIATCRKEVSWRQDYDEPQYGDVGAGAYSGAGGIFKGAAIEVLKQEKRLMSTGTWHFTNGAPVAPVRSTSTLPMSSAAIGRIPALYEHCGGAKQLIACPAVECTAVDGMLAGCLAV